jgi:hypothetical protein
MCDGFTNSPKMRTGHWRLYAKALIYAVNGAEFRKCRTTFAMHPRVQARVVRKKSEREKAGGISSYTLGGFIHILLVIALVVLVIQLITGRRPVV